MACDTDMRTANRPTQWRTQVSKYLVI